MKRILTTLLLLSCLTGVSFAHPCPDSVKINRTIHKTSTGHGTRYSYSSTTRAKNVKKEDCPTFWHRNGWWITGIGVGVIGYVIGHNANSGDHVYVTNSTNCPTCPTPPCQHKPKCK